MHFSPWQVGRVVLAIFGLALSLAPGAQAQTSLRYQFKAGQQLPYLMTQKMAMQMNVMGNNVAITMNQDIDIDWKIQSVDATGAAKMTQKFERIRLTMDGPMGKTEYDSNQGKIPEGPIGQALGPLFQAMAGAEFTLTMDSTGKVTNVTIPEKLRDAFKNSQLGVAGGDLFSEDGLKRLIGSSGVIFPKDGVAPGKTWDNKLESKMPFGTLKVENTFTYEGESEQGGRRLAKIAIKPKMEIEPSPNAALTMKIKSQDTKGAALFDTSAGQLVESTINQTTEMELGIAGQNVVQKIEQTVSMKLKDKAK